MKCPICGFWLTDKLYRIHVNSHKQRELDKNPELKKEDPPAPAEEPEKIEIPKNFQALKALAKEMGVDLGTYRSKADITKEIKRLRDAN